MCRLSGGLLVGAGRAAPVLGVDEGKRRALRSFHRAAIHSRSCLAWRESATDTALVERRCRLFNGFSLLAPVGGIRKAPVHGARRQVGWWGLVVSGEPVFDKFGNVARIV